MKKENTCKSPVLAERERERESKFYGFGFLKSESNFFSFDQRFLPQNHLVLHYSSTYFSNQVFKKEPTTTEDIKKESSISVYPNPAQTSLTIEGIENADYLLFDVTGQLVLSGSVRQQHISVSKVAAGTYFLRLQTAKTIETFPIIIQK